MNMNKYFSFAIIAFLMAVPLVLISCSKDDNLDDVEELQPELKVWTEPYHVEGSTIDEVKNYMDFSMKRYALVSETTIAETTQLTYKTGNGNEGILYSFSASDGALYSVIDTELVANSRLVIDYLRNIILWLVRRTRQHLNTASQTQTGQWSLRQQRFPTPASM